MNHNPQKGVNLDRQHLRNIHTELLKQTHSSSSHNGKVSLSSPAGITVIGGEQAPVADADGRDGWLFKKALADTAKFNYYFYGEGNKAVTLGELVSVCANVSIDNYQSGASIPFFVIYTKMTGVGDAGAWYHSKIIYTMDATETIMLGEEIEMYSINKQDNHHQNKRAVSFNTKIVDGDAATNEEIYTITIHSDSSAPASTQILVSNVGFSIKQNDKVINRRISLS